MCFFGDEVFDDGGVFVVDRDELNIVGRERSGEFVEVWDGRDAGRAPGGPKLEHHDFAVQGSPVRLCAVGRTVELREGERGRGLTNGGRGGVGLQGACKRQSDSHRAKAVQFHAETSID